MKKIRKSLSIFIAAVFLACVIVPAIAETGKVNINTDSKEVLMTMKYVGAKIAERIIEYRKAHPFNSPEDIKNVKGIGNKIYEANKDRIIVKAT